MNKRVFTPFIHVSHEKIEILGEPQNLEALADILKLKAKLGKNISATLKDDMNKPIEIISSDEILDEQE